jgi:prephenate dehydrogenase
VSEPGTSFIERPAGPVPEVVVVIGTGLIGTSIALALRAQGATVWLSDADPAAARLAADLGAGDILPPGPGPAADIAILAVPPAVVGPALAAAQRRALAACYTDVASVKVLPLRSARQLGCDLTTFVPARSPPGPTCSRAGPG